jgi:hypothetical protein
MSKYLSFRSSTLWQPVRSDHICDAGLQYRMQLGVGKHARQLQSEEIVAGSDRYHELMALQLCCVADADAQSDSYQANVAPALLQLIASDAHSSDVACFVRTCYVTAAVASTGLSAAIGRKAFAVCNQHPLSVIIVISWTHFC